MSDFNINIRFYKGEGKGGLYPIPIRFIDNLPSCDDIDSLVYGEEIKTDCSSVEISVYNNIEILTQIISFCKYQEYLSAERMLDIVEELELIKVDNDIEMTLLWGVRHLVSIKNGSLFFNEPYGPDDFN